jgi:tRNA splicing ligase
MKRIIHVIHRSVGSRDYQVRWDMNDMGKGMRTTQILLIICYQIELDKLNIYKTLTCSIPKMCWWLCTISSRCLSLSSVALLAAQEEQLDDEVEGLVRRRT